MSPSSTSPRDPNVFYELGVRHALRDRGTVLLRRKGTPNPFIDFEAKSEVDGRNRAVRSSGDVESILFPLLGSGTARADIIHSARKQLQTR